MESVANAPVERKKIHPQKFAMWMAIGAIFMMFAGLTSAYVIRKSQPNWRFYHLPSTFTISTVVILLSSITMFLGVRAFKKHQTLVYRRWITLTLILGISFCLLQCLGFYQLYHTIQQVNTNDGGLLNSYRTVTLSGSPSESFLFVIAWTHLAHIFGGIIALIIVFLTAFRKNKKVYSATGLEVVATYWHFVDVLWIYLFVFFLLNQ